MHSYRDLPVRIAELGTMYRLERSGELAGLSRVRAMTLNDAHIFCTREQMLGEFKRRRAVHPAALSGDGLRAV